MRNIETKQKQKKNSNTPTQGHKLVWFTVTLIAIPCLFVGYVLLTSMGGQGKPVVGNRFQKGDLEPKITEDNIQSIKDTASTIGSVEDVTINLKSATLRIHLNLVDDAGGDTCVVAINQAYDNINGILPIDTYFTNREDGKMYDIEIDAYNYIVDDVHPAEGQVYYKLTKTGAGSKVIDNLTSPKDSELVSQITR